MSAKFLGCWKIGFGLLRVLNIIMLLTAVFEGVNTVLARKRIFISIILNLERPFFAVLREFHQGVHGSLEFFKGVR